MATVGNDAIPSSYDVITSCGLQRQFGHSINPHKAKALIFLKLRRLSHDSARFRFLLFKEIMAKK